MRDISGALISVVVALEFGVMSFPRLPKWLRLGVALPAVAAACTLLFWPVRVPIGRDLELALHLGGSILLLAVIANFLIRKPWMAK